METVSTLLTLCEGNPTVTRGLSEKASIGGFDILFDVEPPKKLNKQSKAPVI